MSLPDRLVMDASAAIAWVTDEDGAGARLDLFMAEAKIVVPPLWLLEVSNSLLTKERRRKYASEHVSTLLASLDAIEPEVVPASPSGSASAWAAFARPHQLTTYDACYLELALRLGLPLLTLDNNLRDAARRIGVALVLDRQTPTS